jgi:hypothetical protein
MSLFFLVSLGLPSQPIYVLTVEKVKQIPLKVFLQAYQCYLVTLKYQAILIIKMDHLFQR